MFQADVVQEHACHFQIRVGDGAQRVLEGDKCCAYVGRPGDVPDNQMQKLCATKPYAARTKGGCVTETNISWAARNVFMTVGRARGDNAEKDAEVIQSGT